MVIDYLTIVFKHLLGVLKSKNILPSLSLPINLILDLISKRTVFSLHFLHHHFWNPTYARNES